MDEKQEIPIELKDLIKEKQEILAKIEQKSLEAINAKCILKCNNCGTNKNLRNMDRIIRKNKEMKKKFKREKIYLCVNCLHNCANDVLKKIMESKQEANESTTK